MICSQRVCLVSIATVVVVIVLASAPPAFADSEKGLWALNLGQWSSHFDNDKENETHNLVAVEYDGWTAGYMRNSDDNDSLVAGYHFRWPLNDWFTPGVRVGLATGYDDGINDSGIYAGILLTGFFHIDGVGVEFNLLPWPDDGFVSAGFRFEF